MTPERLATFGVLVAGLSAVILPAALRLVPRWRRWVVAIAVVAIVLRAGLASVNLYAHDDHVSVIEVMAYEHRTPTKDELPEAFQPPLYYRTTAAVLQCLPGRSAWKTVRVAQGVSCLAGGVTVALCAWFLLRSRASDASKLIAFGWIALDPQMIAIHAQATNDGFVIACGTAAFLAAGRMFETGSWRWLAAAVVAAGGACLSKGNGLVVPLAVVTTGVASALFGGAAAPWTRARLAWTTGAFVTGVVGLAVLFGPYVDHARRYGSPFVINAEKPPFPHLFEKTVVAREDVRPGVRSIADAVFTFRFVNLLEEPMLGNVFNPPVYPEHRTSLWTQVYSGAHAANAGGSPKKWVRQDAWNAATLRGIYLLALLPTGVLLWRMVRRAATAVRAVLPGGAHALAPPQDLLHDVAAVGFLAFLVVYVVPYRDIGFFKALFVFPAVLCYLALFTEGWDALEARVAARPAWRIAVHSSIALLFVLYAANAALVIAWLA